VRRSRFPAALLFLLSCADPVEEPTVSLSSVSEQITFRSVSSLGPHHMLATVTRIEEWEDGTEDEHQETVELAWNDWNRFHFRRLVDGKAVFESIVSDGKAYSRTQGAGWRADLDPEPARQALRTTWNVWHAAFDPVGDRIGYTEVGPSTIDTRPARHFAVGLTEPAEGIRIRRSQPQPETVTGNIWLDEATAVRLSADVTTVLRLPARRHRIHLQLTRSGFGSDQPVHAPAVRAQRPRDLLGQKPPPRRSKRARRTGPRRTDQP
jgi:hypothetical protein